MTFDWRKLSSGFQIDEDALGPAFRQVERHLTEERWEIDDVLAAPLLRRESDYLRSVHELGGGAYMNIRGPFSCLIILAGLQQGIYRFPRREPVSLASLLLTGLRSVLSDQERMVLDSSADSDQYAVMMANQFQVEGAFVAYREAIQETLAKRRVQPHQFAIAGGTPGRGCVMDPERIVSVLRCIPEMWRLQVSRWNGYWRVELHDESGLIRGETAWCKRLDDALELAWTQGAEG